MASCSNERPTLLVAVGRIVAGHGASRVRRRRADRAKQRVQKVPFIVADDRQRAPFSASTDSPGRRQSRSRFRVRSISSLLILASMSSIVVERKASWAMASFFFWVRGGPVVSRPRGCGLLRFGFGGAQDCEFASYLAAFLHDVWHHSRTSVRAPRCI